MIASVCASVPDCRDCVCLCVCACLSCFRLSVHLRLSGLPRSSDMPLQPLGHWKFPHSRSRLDHFSYATSDRLYVRTQAGEYQRCHKGRSQIFEFGRKTIKSQDIPVTVVPVEIEASGNEHWRLVHRTAITQCQRQPVATFKDYIHNLEAWEIDLLEHTELLADPNTICLELQESFAAGSDGSEKFGTDGAFGWTLSNTNGESGKRNGAIARKCNGFVPGRV